MSADGEDDKVARPKPVGSVTISGAAGRPSIYYSLWISEKPDRRQSVRRQLRERQARPGSAPGSTDDNSDENPVNWSYETELKGRKE